MTDLITVTGVVGSDPRHTVTAQGLAITSFRLASTRRYFDRAKGSWEDGETNWYTVAMFRNLAVNAARSVRKGERVVVHGRLRLRAWDTGEKSGLAVEIEADSVGHDLTWGISSYVKAGPARSAEAGVDALPTTAGLGNGWPTGGELSAAAPFIPTGASLTEEQGELEADAVTYAGDIAADADTASDEVDRQVPALAG